MWINEVADEAGVGPSGGNEGEGEAESSCGIGNGKAKWINTFDLNELPSDADAEEDNAWNLHWCIKTLFIYIFMFRLNNGLLCLICGMTYNIYVDFTVVCYLQSLLLLFPISVFFENIEKPYLYCN